MVLVNAAVSSQVDYGVVHQVEPKVARLVQSVPARSRVQVVQPELDPVVEGMT